ncbi:MAG TPA: hypothetical protein VM076_19930 [Gemmatimonadaceae bacterium]|nr:hypothetical protein [Gemmatimonadaceae bacterium]
MSDRPQSVPARSAVNHALSEALSVPAPQLAVPAPQLAEGFDYVPDLHIRNETPRLTRRRWRALSWSAVATSAAIAVAFIVRGVLVLSRDFPLNDGALFYLMAEELTAHGFHLPAFTAYNAASIPFAYSPLGFYLAAALDALPGVSLVDVFRVLPLLFSALCVVAFYLLARELIPSRYTVIAALWTFALLPRSFLWLIMGGGLTRSIGFFFAILTLWQVQRAYTRKHWRHVGWATVFASLTVLSHLGTAPFVAFSSALMLLYFGRSRFGIYASIAIGLGTVILTAPWWVSVASAHGLAPFAAAGATGGTVFGTHTRGEALAKLGFFGLGTAEPLFPIIGALAIFGAFATLTRRGGFLPLWWLAIILLDTRAGATYASIPVALLAGIALTEVIVPIIARPPSWINSMSTPVPGTGWDALVAAPRRRHWTVAIVLVVLASYGITSSLLRRPSLNAEGRYLTSLTADDRDAMSWVARATPKTSRFLIVVGGAAGGWWADRVGEWFPVLGHRVSVATVQGTEWLPRGVFDARERQYNELQGCAAWGSRCLEQWSHNHQMPFSHIYIPKTLAFPCCAPLDTELRRDPSFELVFDGPGASVYERRRLILE